MAAKLNQGTIQFTEIQIPAKTVGAVLGRSPYLSPAGIPVNDSYVGYIKEPVPYINAIDIIWDGAVLQKNGVTIRTSADLLAQLEVIYEKFGDYAPKSVEESIQGFTEQILEAKEKAEQALELAQTNNQVQSNWLETDQESPAFILNKPTIPASIYDLNNWNDFATQQWINERLRRFNSAYDIYAEQQQNAGQTPLSQEAWIESLHGEQGVQGKSAYDIAVENGFIGSKSQWLESIKGATGPQGEAGKDGNSVQIISSFDTIDELREEVEGKYYTLGSAYLVDGYLYVYNDSGTTFEEQWKNVGKIKGPKGDKGEQGERGKSNYEIYKDLAELNGEIPLSEADWLESIKGEKGKSNYDIYVELAELNGETPLSEADWLESLKVKTTYTAGSSITISENNVISFNSSETWVVINESN